MAQPKLLHFVQHYDLPMAIEKYLSNPPKSDVLTLKCPICITLAFQRTYHLLKLSRPSTTKASLASCCISNGLSILRKNDNITSMLDVVSTIHQTDYSGADYEFLLHALGNLKIPLSSGAILSTRASENIIGRLHEDADYLSANPQHLAAFAIAITLSTQSYPQKDHRQQMVEAVEQVFGGVGHVAGIGGPVVQAVGERSDS